MYKRLPYLLSCLAVLCIVSTPAALPQVKGAVVQTWYYDPQAKTLTIRMANISGKDITAFTISITITFADHHVSNGGGGGERLVDMLPAVFLVQKARGTPDEDRVQREFGNGTWAAGQTRDEVLSNEAVVTDVQVTISVVAYADGTAETSNPPALERLREHRNAEIRSYQKAEQIIKEVLADSTVQNPAEEAAVRLRKFLTVWSSQTHYSVDIEPNIIELAIRNLSLLAGRHLSDEPKVLQQYLAEKGQYVSFISKHVELKGASQ